MTWCAENLLRLERLQAEEELLHAAPSDDEAENVCCHWLDQSAVCLAVSRVHITSSGCSCAIIGGIDART